MAEEFKMSDLDQPLRGAELLKAHHAAVFESFVAHLRGSYECSLLNETAESLKERGIALVARVAALTNAKEAALPPSYTRMLRWETGLGGAPAKDAALTSIDRARLEAARFEEIAKTPDVSLQHLRTLRAFVQDAAGDLSADTVGRVNIAVKTLRDLFGLRSAAPITFTAVGYENSGKTTTINAIIGAEALRSAETRETRCPYIVEVIKTDGASSRNVLVTSATHSIDIVRAKESARSPPTWSSPREAEARVAAHNAAIGRSAEGFSSEPFYLCMEGADFPFTTMLCDTPGLCKAGTYPVERQAQEELAESVVRQCIRDRMKGRDDYCLVVQDFTREGDDFFSVNVRSETRGLDARQFLHVFNKVDKPFTVKNESEGSTDAPFYRAECITRDHVSWLNNQLRAAAELDSPVATRKATPFFVSLGPVDALRKWNDAKPTDERLSETALFTKIYEIIAREEEARWEVLQAAATRHEGLRDTLAAIGKEHFQFACLVREYKLRVRDRMVDVARVISDEVDALLRSTLELAKQMDTKHARETLFFPYALQHAVGDFCAEWEDHFEGVKSSTIKRAQLARVFVQDERFRRLDGAAPLDLDFAAEGESTADRSVGAPWGRGKPLTQALELNGLAIGCHVYENKRLSESEMTNFMPFYQDTVDHCLSKLAGIYVKAVDLLELEEAQIDITNGVDLKFQERVAKLAIKHIQTLWTQGILYLISTLDVALEHMRTECIRGAHQRLSADENQPFWRQPQAVAKLEQAAALAHRQFLADMRDELLGQLRTDRCRGLWDIPAANAQRATQYSRLLEATPVGRKANFSSDMVNIVSSLRLMLGIGGEAPPDGAAAPPLPAGAAAGAAAARPPPAAPAPPLPPTFTPIPPQGGEGPAATYAKHFFALHSEMLRRVSEVVRVRGLSFVGLRRRAAEESGFLASFEQYAQRHVVSVALDHVLPRRPLMHVHTAFSTLGLHEVPRDVLEAAYGFVSPTAEKRELHERLTRVVRALGGGGGARLGGGAGGAGRAP